MSLGIVPTRRCTYAMLVLAGLVAAGAFVPVLLDVAVLAAIVLAAALATDVLLGPQAAQVVIRRDPIGHVTLGNPVRLRYRVHNPVPSPIAVGIAETPVALLRFSERNAMTTIGAYGDGVLEGEALPVERGEAALGMLYAWIENRVGLLRRHARVDAPGLFRVWPDTVLRERGVLARRHRLIDAGLRRLRLKGQGSEFESLREWSGGDEFRSIEWKATARRGKLIVAQQEVERSQTIVLALDMGRLMMPRIGAPRKFDYALAAALSVAEAAGAVDDRVGLLAFGSRVEEYIVPRAGKTHLNALLRRAYDLQPSFVESDYEGAFGYLRRKQSKRSLVIVFTDMLDPVAAGELLSDIALLTPRHLVLCVMMNDAAVSDALTRRPTVALDAYRTSVAAVLEDERSRSVALLERRGVGVLDVPAQDLRLALVNRYIDIKARNLL